MKIKKKRSYFKSNNFYKSNFLISSILSKIIWENNDWKSATKITLFHRWHFHSRSRRTRATISRFRDDPWNRLRAAACNPRYPLDSARCSVSPSSMQWHPANTAGRNAIYIQISINEYFSLNWDWISNE